MQKKQSFLSTFFDLFEILFIGVTVFAVVYLFVGQLLEVTGESMYPSFKDKEQIIAEKLSIKYKDLERGEVIIFNHPKNTDKLLIKRVIGLPGEIVKVENGAVYINGEKLIEDYLPENTVTNRGSFISESLDYQVPINEYLLMGDNREKSTDSRDWGFVKKELVIGRGVLVYYPLQNLRFIKN